jgi:hypothetical protein
VTSLSESGLPEVSTPQHLPPLGFLNPSTVCSSEQRACFISHRHHVWGSKSGNRATGDRGASSAGRFWERLPPSRRDTRGRLEGPQPLGGACRVVRFHDVCIHRVDSQPSCRCVTHHHPRERRQWEAGSSTDHSEDRLDCQIHHVSSRISRHTPSSEPVLQRSSGSEVSGRFLLRLCVEWAEAVTPEGERL